MKNIPKVENFFISQLLQYRLTQYIRSVKKYSGEINPNNLKL